MGLGGAVMTEDDSDTGSIETATRIARLVDAGRLAAAAGADSFVYAILCGLIVGHHADLSAPEVSSCPAALQW